jgi:hypothetical protein
MHLAFGLGKALEDLRQYDTAFDFFIAGNAIKRASFDFSVSRVEDYFGRLKETFSAALFSAAPAGETPTFVLGMLRRGRRLHHRQEASQLRVRWPDPPDAAQREDRSLLPRRARHLPVHFQELLLGGRQFSCLRSG